MPHRERSLWGFFNNFDTLEPLFDIISRGAVNPEKGELSNAI